MARARGRAAARPPQTDHGLAVVPDPARGQPLAEEVDDLLVVEGFDLLVVVGVVENDQDLFRGEDAALNGRCGGVKPAQVQV
jgi:hypothetical protein